MTGEMVMRPSYSVGPLSFAIEADVLEAWLMGAETGDEIVYATGPALPQSAAAVVLARALSEDGLVRTHLRRVGRSFEYFAVKRSPDPNPPAPIRHAAPRGDDDADTRVLRALCRAANLGQMCPSNAELAKLCGLSDPDAASYRVRKLIQAGAIRSEDQGPNRRRIVTIVASGMKTVPGAL